MKFWILGICHGDNKKTESKENSIDIVAREKHLGTFLFHLIDFLMRSKVGLVEGWWSDGKKTLSELVARTPKPQTT